MLPQASASPPFPSNSVYIGPHDFLRPLCSVDDRGVHVRLPLHPLTDQFTFVFCHPTRRAPLAHTSAPRCSSIALTIPKFDVYFWPFFSLILCGYGYFAFLTSGRVDYPCSLLHPLCRPLLKPFASLVPLFVSGLTPKSR